MMERGVTVPRQLLHHLLSEGLAWISADGSIRIDGWCFYSYVSGELTGIHSHSGVRTVSSHGTVYISVPIAASLQGGAAALMTVGGDCGRATGLVLYHVDDEEAALAGPQPYPFSPVKGFRAATKMVVYKQPEQAWTAPDGSLLNLPSGAVLGDTG